ncbi:ATP-binding protein [Alteribacter natronophilus]|uniref:ATP-binding protein n=1 Tax=Alteribacter natronophilus TaxID=2583810 RepID=UPI001486D6E5|nr:AAA family ATPase [Alteribacter natronophilus]
MIITGIEVYGFGKWRSQSFTPEKGMNLFYGENEAGKSTLMVFIRSVLFGFPRRSEQFEPLAGGDFGGSLTVHIEREGKVRIERVRKRKAKGDVTLYFPDGRTGGEEDLTTLLEGMTEQVYRGIFAFSLQGLQGIESMNAQELNDYLYDASLSGGQSLLACEREAEREMQQLFRPRGKKQPVNEQLKRLQDMERDVKEKEEKAGSYADLLGRRKEAEERLARLEQKKDQIQLSLGRWERVERLSPLYREYLALKESSDPDLTFPDRGKEKLEQLQKQRHDNTEAIRRGEKEAAKLKEKKTAFTPVLPREKAVRLEARAVELNKRSGVYQELVSRQAGIEQERSISAGNMREIEEDWAWSRQDELLQHRDTTKTSRQRMKFLTDEVEQAERRRELAVKEQGRLNSAKEGLKKRMASVEEQILPLDQERAYRQKLTRLAEYETVKKKLPEYKAKLMSGKRSAGRIIPAAGAGMIISGAAGLFTGEAITGTGALLTGLFLLLYTTFFSRFGNTGDSSDQEIRDELTGWERFDKEAAEWPVEEWRRALAVHEENVREKARTQHLLNETESHLSIAEKEAAEAEKLQDAANDALMEWAIQAGFEPGRGYRQYKEMVNDTLEWQEQYKKHRELSSQLDELNKEQQSFEADVNRLAEEAGINEEDRQAEAPAVLTSAERKIKDALRAHRESETIEEKIRENLLRLKSAEEELEKTQTAVRQLLTSAGAAGEEEFAEKEAAWQKEKQTRKRISDLELEMRAISPKTSREKDLEACIRWGEAAESKREETGEIKKETEKLVRETIEELSLTNQAIEELEEGSSLEETLQQFELEKESLATSAEKWAVLALAREIAGRTKEILERERQPAVLQEAEKLFERLTDGRYTGLYAPLGEESFVVQRHDQIRFEPASLSQGTRELLYLSLRFALALNYGKEVSFPIMIDEAFVNFDSGRRRRVMNVLRELAPDRQVLCFTCHGFMIDEQPGLRPVYLNPQPEKGAVSR